MKFIAIAAIAIVAAQEEEAPAEEAAACAEGECNVTDAETMETTCTVVVEGETVCDPEAAAEEEGSNALFASAAAVAVAATLMY
mgnify:CR=1 FL=1